MLKTNKVGVCFGGGEEGEKNPSKIFRIRKVYHFVREMMKGKEY